jgi:hypothetical protein
MKLSIKSFTAFMTVIVAIAIDCHYISANHIINQ